MELKILEKSSDSIRFVLSESDVGMANAIRRTLIGGIPVLSIEEADVENNNSGLFDEALVRRLGLIPLTFDPVMYSLQSECKCNGEGCSRCQMVLVAEKEGPCIVKAGDMKSTDPSVRSTDPDIPIVELLEGQKLKFEATARLGFGRKKARNQAAIAGYQNIYIVKAEGKAKPCEAHTLEKKGANVRLAPMDGCKDCVRFIEGNEARHDETAFVFNVETASGLEAPKLLDMALERIEKNAEDFLKDAKKAIK
ncbi:MAG: DNA-directed RNA polymerase subunit D [Candidatus Aenigmarchaeota archaeon]|nr:DNA-directed RNA polymerase subunit D [Candidatus Aenigmarchaeota archaeon]